MTLSPVDPTDPVGNPHFPRRHLAPEDGLRVFFLGGPLGHTTRLVQRDPDHPARPAREKYVWAETRLQRPGGRLSVREPEPLPKAVYVLTRVDTGITAWFCYVLEGHTPSRSDLLDANPYPI